jgi:hypothetical protein
MDDRMQHALGQRLAALLAITPDADAAGGKHLVTSAPDLTPRQVVAIQLD